MYDYSFLYNLATSSSLTKINQYFTKDIKRFRTAAVIESVTEQTCLARTYIVRFCHVSLQQYRAVRKVEVKLITRLHANDWLRAWESSKVFFSPMTFVSNVNQLSSTAGGLSISTDLWKIFYRKREATSSTHIHDFHLHAYMHVHAQTPTKSHAVCTLEIQLQTLCVYFSVISVWWQRKQRKKLNFTGSSQIENKQRVELNSECVFRESSKLSWATEEVNFASSILTASNCPQFNSKQFLRASCLIKDISLNVMQCNLSISVSLVTK